MLVTLGVVVTVLVLVGRGVVVRVGLAVGVLLGPLVVVRVQSCRKLTLHGVAVGVWVSMRVLSFWTIYPWGVSG